MTRPYLTLDSIGREAVDGWILDLFAHRKRRAAEAVEMIKREEAIGMDGIPNRHRAVATEVMEVLAGTMTAKEISLGIGGESGQTLTVILKALVKAGKIDRFEINSKNARFAYRRTQ